jgi:hypothetical protein
MKLEVKLNLLLMNKNIKHQVEIFMIYKLKAGNIV